MKLSKANQKKVQEVVVDAGIYMGEVSYFVELNWGFCFMEQGCHCFGEDTQKDVRASLRDFVRPCNCTDCKEELESKEVQRRTALLFDHQ